MSVISLQTGGNVANHSYDYGDPDGDAVDILPNPVKYLSSPIGTNTNPLVSIKEFTIARKPVPLPVPPPPPPPLPLNESLSELGDGQGLPVELPAPENPDEPLECGECEESGPYLKCMVCNLCQVAYCEPCWPKIAAHKVGKKGLKGIRKQVHEPIDPVIERKLEKILEPQVGEEDQEALHRQDEETAWFAVIKDNKDKLVFQDLGRYGEIVSGLNEETYPALVSFVGSTGSGKSTLIRMLMELDYPGEVPHETPVVQSAACFSTVPTSGDVHLFCDPHTYKTENRHPILYADCEGLEGGERTPLGSRTHKREKIRKAVSERISGAKQDTKSFFARRGRDNAMQQNSKRELKWAINDATKRREYIVSELYPRILFTFSDVVVFVLQEKNKLENAIERLLIWATAALEKSSNQPVLPRAIIALNPLPSEVPDIFWAADTATKQVLHEANIEFSKNPKFIPFIRHWKGRDKNVETIEDLLKLYYDDMRVVGIPRKGRSNLIKQQVSQLYREIKTSVQRSHRMKRERRMLMNSKALQFHLQSAYDHFANSLSTSFDFVKSTFAHSPIPPNFGGSILKLILNVRKNTTKMIEEGKPVAGTVEKILESVAPMIASCILLDAARQQIPGTASHIFPEYKHSCDNAFKDFYEQHLECAYRSPRDPKVRCVNYRAGHKSKGHQDSSGKIIATGDYTASLDLDYISTFGKLILESLDSMVTKSRVGQGSGESETREEEATLVASLHKNDYMVPLYKGFGGGTNFISHTACLVCLFHSPEHHLNCGHVICTPCLQTYGTIQAGCIAIQICPMHPDDKTYQSSQLFTVKPPSAGVRVLSLDGGGVRGLSQLIFLEGLENTLGFDFRMTSFFDLIVGTSTGGHIALGLVTENWSITDCIEQFKKFCRKSFSKRKLGNLLGIQDLVGAKYKYKREPLENVLIKAFSTSDYLFGGTKRTITKSSSGPAPKVAVTTASSTGKVIVLGNYNHVDTRSAFYEFSRSEIPENEFRTWEAARATCATPGYLKEFSHAASKDVYLDGGIYHNNPIFIADSERKLIWPEVNHLPPDIVLSLGSGYSPNSAKPRKEKKFRSRSVVARATEKLHWTATDHIESGLVSEETWNTWLKSNGFYVNPAAGPTSIQRTGNRYVRWNAKFDKSDDPPHLDDLDSLQRIEYETRKQVQSLNSPIKVLADHLICSTFYFELHDAKEHYGRFENPDGILVKGSIMCRWGPHNADICKLGKLLQSLNSTRGLDPSWQPSFTIRETSKSPGNLSADPIYLSQSTIQQMIDKETCKFELPEIEFIVSNWDASVEISLCLDNSSEFPISGFPCQMLVNMPNGILPKDPFLRRTRTWSDSAPSLAPTSPDSTRTSSESQIRDTGPSWRFSGRLF
ncbi:hypothetical protein EYR41_007494 [Orbilia oligospora]|uniref:PNPLA domain-containing protein n=2 Tax=Orbilia oligospora TaxID=2813651 RepID=A0A8H2E0X6_ORBOL|nr:hypothetical protein EYR41_007494 [Orbilia oligospora]